jgi:4-hydroxy-L-threonine phosphate dehydrogenase PdxA
MLDPAPEDTMRKQASAPLVVTQGDPSGIGPEIAIKAWLARDAATPPWFLLADPQHIARMAATLGLSAPVASVTPAQAAETFARALPVVPLEARVSGAPGQPDPQDAPATLESIERGVMLVASGQASATVCGLLAATELPLSCDALVLTPTEHAELLASGSAMAAALQRDSRWLWHRS